MLLTRFIAGMFSIGTMTLAAGAACGQDFPSKAIRIVTADAGGGTDFVSRLIAQGISGGLGQQVIIDNRPSGVIPGDVVAKAQPDGYTLLVTGSIFWIGQFLRDKTPYDSVKDFAPVSLVVSSPTVLVVHPSLPVKGVRDLIALAKARPGELNYASAGAGSPNHLAGELFKSLAGVNIVRIPYKGGGPALSALLSGEVQMLFATAASVTSHVKSGRLRTLAVTSLQPSALLPGLPTVAASGLPGYEADTIYGMFAPARTPEAIINQLNQETVRALNRPEVKDKFASAGVEVIASSPQKLAATVISEMARVGKLIKDAGIRAE